MIKHHNILRNTNVTNHLNETNVAISLRVSITNHLKLVQIYLPNPVLGGGVIGDSLGALGHGVLGQLIGEEQTNGSLNLPRGNGGRLVVVPIAKRLLASAAMRSKISFTKEFMKDIALLDIPVN